MFTVSHGGCAGDIIYAGPAMRAIADREGDVLDVVIYRYPADGRIVPRQLQTPQTTAAIAPLLLAQPYVGSVRYADQAEGCRLDGWRDWFIEGVGLCAAHLMQAKAAWAWSLARWLVVPCPNTVAPVVFHRSPRYQNPAFPWKRVLEAYAGRAVMVGMPHEHEAFCREVGDVPYHPTANFLELAQVIAGAHVFVGNQSAPYAIAEGIKQNTVQEVCLGQPDCVFPRGNAIYGIDERTPLIPLPSA